MKFVLNFRIGFSVYISSSSINQENKEKQFVNKILFKLSRNEKKSVNIKLMSAISRCMQIKMDNKRETQNL